MEEQQRYDDHSSSSLKDMMPTAISSFFSAYAPFAGYMFMLQSMNTNFIPYEFKSYVYSYLKSSLSYFLDPLANHITLYVDDSTDEDYFDGSSQSNLVYEAAEAYLATKINPKSQYFRISQAPKQKVPKVVVTTNQEITDTFENIKVKWRMLFPEENYRRGARSCIELTFHRKHKDKVINSYIPYVLARAEAIKVAEKTPKLYSYNGKRASVHHYGIDDEDDFAPSSGKWSCVDHEHPATFETMAMEPELKRTIIEDLDKFVKRREFYKRVGKAWKRGYLLYGPPGTGKSSLVAAMANHLHFNIYDLELTTISSNEELRKALMSTTNRSIVVFEDIDCSKESISRESTKNKNREKTKSKFTLSGLLNVIDGLWSSCGDERILVFTTNHKERLDPALLRPGRMDMHINMSYCTPKGFKTLASNYLGIQDTSKHQLCPEIEGLMESTNITPAEVCEELMRGGGDGDETDVALEGLVKCLKRKRLETTQIEEKAGKAKRQEIECSASLYI